MRRTSCRARSGRLAQRQAAATATATGAGPQRNFFCAIPEVRPPASPTILPVAFRGPARGTQARAISTATATEPHRRRPSPPRTAPGAPAWVGPHRLRDGSSGTAHCPGPVRNSPSTMADTTVRAIARTRYLARAMVLPGWQFTPAWSAPERTARRQPSRATAHTRASALNSATIESMTIPGRVAAAALLSSLDPPDWFLAHARAVAEVAGFLAARDRGKWDGRLIGRSSRPRPCSMTSTRSFPRSDPVRRLGHGHGSAAWLTEHGHPELARAVAAHPVTRLADGEALSALGGLREPGGAHRRVRRQARGQRLVSDGGPLRVLAATLSRWLGRGDLASRPSPGGTPGSRGLPSGRHHAGRGPTIAVDGRCLPCRARPRSLAR